MIFECFSRVYYCKIFKSVPVKKNTISVCPVVLKTFCESSKGVKILKAVAVDKIPMT